MELFTFQLYFLFLFAAHESHISLERKSLSPTQREYKGGVFVSYPSQTTGGVGAGSTA